MVAYLDVSPEQTNWGLVFAFALLPLGWTLVGHAVLLAPLALLQSALVFSTPLLAYIFVCHRLQSHLWALLAALVGYFGLCFVTNYLGLFLLSRL